MRLTRAIPALATAVLLASMLGGCTVRIVDPGAAPSDASDGSRPEHSSETPRPVPDASDAGSTPSADPDDSSGLSDEGQAERERLTTAATTTMPCPTGPLTEDGAIIRVEGACDALVIEVDAGAVVADDVGSLTLAGSGTVVYVTSADAITVTGSASSVFWEGETPTVQDSGSANVLKRG